MSPPLTCFREMCRGAYRWVGTIIDCMHMRHLVKCMMNFSRWNGEASYSCKVSMRTLLRRCVCVTAHLNACEMWYLCHEKYVADLVVLSDLERHVRLQMVLVLCSMHATCFICCVVLCLIMFSTFIIATAFLVAMVLEQMNSDVVEYQRKVTLYHA